MLSDLNPDADEGLGDDPLEDALKKMLSDEDPLDDEPLNEAEEIVNDMLNAEDPEPTEADKIVDDMLNGEPEEVEPTEADNIVNEMLNGEPEELEPTEADNIVNEMLGNEGEDNFKSPLNIFGIHPDEEEKMAEDGETGPFTKEDAVNEIRELTGRSPSNDEVNDWLNEMNAPFNVDYLTDGEFSINSGSDIMNYSFFILLAAMVISGLLWRRNRNKDDSGFAKSSDPKGIFDSLKNPFNRKKDGDDDFDKVL